MPELTAPGPVAENAGIREAVCIRIYMRSVPR